MDELRKVGEDPLRANMLFRLKETLNANWIFEKWYEKMILFLLMAWAVYSIGRLFF